MNRTLNLYPGWLRAWHWTNVGLFVALAITGTSMHFAEPGAPQVDFRTARFVHNSAGLLLTAFYIFYLAGNALGRNGHYYLPQGDDLGRGLLRQARYYLGGIFRGEPHPYGHSRDRKFNPLQKLTYAGLMYLVYPLLLVSGWLMFFPEKMPERLAGVTGVGVVSLAHSAIGYALSLFMVVHIYLGTTGETPGALFRAMWTGSVTPPADPDPSGS